MLKKLVKTVWLFLKQRNKRHYIHSCLSFLKVSLLLFTIKRTKKKVVAICLIEHIGDIIANEPIAREARRQNPDATIIWFVRKPFVEILKYNPFIDRIITVHCLTTWILVKRRQKFGALYEMHFKGRFCPKCMIYLEKDNCNDEIKGINYYNFGGLLKAACLHNKLPVLNDTPKLYIPQKAIDSLSKKLAIKHYIVVHCRSNEAIRDWEDLKWLDLMEQIMIKYRMPVIEIGLKGGLASKNPLYLNYCGKLELMETAELIRNAIMFCGVDSAPAHMANAAETPGVILLGEYFGMKNYNSYTGNYGNKIKCRLVYSDTFVKDLPVAKVMENI